MARFADVNIQYATHNETMFQFKQKMKLAGWTVSSSGDGLSAYGATSDVITGYVAGANGLGNNRSWYVLREPGGRREYSIQRVSNQSYRIKYSALARFVIGAPNSTTTPDATDEQTLNGTGTSASPGGGTFLGSENVSKIHHVIESTPINGAYAFFWYVTSNTSGGMQGVFAADPIQAGTHSDQAADPIVDNCSPFNSFIQWKGWCYFGSASPSWQLFEVFGLSGGPVGGTSGALDPLNRDPVITMMHYSQTTWKGISALMKSKTINVRAYPSTINRDTECYVYMTSHRHLFPFKNGVDPAL
jgi:hypothetical protein